MRSPKVESLAKMKKLLFLLSVLIGALMIFGPSLYAIVGEQDQSTQNAKLTRAKSKTTGFVLPARSSSTAKVLTGNRQALSQTSPQPHLPESTPDAEYVPGRLIVKFKDDSQSAVAKTLANVQARSAGFARRIQIKGAPRKLFQNSPMTQDAIQKKLESLRSHLQSKRLNPHEEIKLRSEERRLNRLLRGEKMRLKHGLDRVYVVPLAGEENVQEAVDEFKKDSNVEYAEPDYIAKVQIVPNDPYYPDLWGHHKIHTQEAWETVLGEGKLPGEGIVVAVIDTGLDYNHPDIWKNVWVNPNAVNDINGDGIVDLDDADINHDYMIDSGEMKDNMIGSDFISNDNDPKDDHGHGTHVSGTIAAVGNNGIGIIGIAYGAKILAIKGLDRYGNGNTSGLSKAVRYAADMGADVLNNSWGGFGLSKALTDAFHYANDLDVVAIAAAGNSNGDVAYFGPASIDTVISVAATDPSDQKAWFSNYGARMDIAAPGVDVLSLRAQDTSMGSTLNAQYTRANGTSMACPHAAGLAALVLSRHPEFKPRQMRNALRTSGDDLGESGWDIYFGYGRINAEKAVQINQASDGVAQIGAPHYQEEVRGLVDITGTALDQDLDHYAVFFRGSEPLQPWIEICRSGNSVESNILCAGFDTVLADEGEIYLRLSVVDQNQDSADFITALRVNSIEITNPLGSDVLRAGDPIEIQGFITFDFTDYQLEYGRGKNPDTWVSEGIVKTPGPNNILGTWETQNIHEADYYSLRLTVNRGAIVKREVAKNFYFDPTLKAGWPKRIPYARDDAGDFYYWTGFLEPIVSDLDLDGKKEILVYRWGQPPEIFVYRQDGTLFWSRKIDSAEEGPNPVLPVLGDLNNDGYDEIFVYHYEFWSQEKNARLFAYDHNGNPLGGNWPASVIQDFRPTMAIADLDLDGDPEIVIQGNGGDTEGRQMMAVVNFEGRVISQWDLPVSRWDATVRSSPAIGNFDDDPELEIVFASPSSEAGWTAESGWNNDGVIYIFNMDGSVINGQPIVTPGVIFSTPAVGDLNHDGSEDIVVGLMYETSYGQDNQLGGIYAFDQAGGVLPGWPVRKGYGFWSSPSLADVNGDGYLETAASELGTFSTYLFRHDGSIEQGWPVQTSWNDYYGSVRGDVNGDGIADIVTTAGSGFYGNGGGVYAWGTNGNLIPGFPKITEVDAQAPAVIDDIDFDGKVELIAASDWDHDVGKSVPKYRGSIYVWELDAAHDPNTAEWPTFKRDIRRTGRYNSPRNPNVPLTLNVPNTIEVYSGEERTYRISANAKSDREITVELGTHPDWIELLLDLTKNYPGHYEADLWFHPPAGEPERDFELSVTARDGVSELTRNILVSVRQRNLPPYFVNLPENIKGQMYEPFSFQVEVRDPNRETSLNLDAFVERNGEIFADLTSQLASGPNYIDENQDGRLDYTQFIYEVRWDQPVAGAYDMLLTARDGLTSVNQTIPLEVTEPFTLVSVVSRKTHGASGPYDLSLPWNVIPIPGTANFSIESRTGSTLELLFTFNQVLSEADIDSIYLSHGRIESKPLIDDGVLTIRIRDIPETSLLFLTLFLKLSDQSRFDAVVPIGMLPGDVNNDCVVDIVDLSEIKTHLFKPLTGKNVFRSDINADGVINIVDLAEAKMRFGKTIEACSNGGETVLKKEW